MSDERLDRMGAFDSVMWGVEKDPILRSVITVVALLDEEPRVDLLIDRIDRMTSVVPKLRQRVIGNPVSPIPPRWEDDPNFDITYHLKRFHVPADGTDRPLLRIAEQMAEQDFDRDRPLWEMALVQGWDDPRSAIVVKLHHAITDGVGGMRMAANLFDLTREVDADEEPAPEESSSGVLGVPGRLVNGALFAARSAVDVGQSLAGSAISVASRVVTDPGESFVAGAAFAHSAARLLSPADEPMSPLMRGRSLSVRMAVVQVPFAALRAASHQSGGTVNDTYMAAVSGGVAAYHESRRAPCEYVRVNMPVNMRASGDESDGNRWVPARFPMPLDDGDPVVRIKRLSPLLAQARTEPALQLSDSVYRLLTALPRSATTSIAAGMMKGCDLAVTNVPGPPVALYASGAKVRAIVPFAPKAGAAVNIAMLTYDGTAFVGLNIDTRSVPDADAFVEHIRTGFDHVLAIGDPQVRASIGLRPEEDPPETAVGA